MLTTNTKDLANKLVGEQFKFMLAEYYSSSTDYSNFYILTNKQKWIKIFSEEFLVEKKFEVFFVVLEEFFELPKIGRFEEVNLNQVKLKKINFIRTEEWIDNGFYDKNNPFYVDSGIEFIFEEKLGMKIYPANFPLTFGFEIKPYI